MKNKNKFIDLKKFDFLENITNDGLISQLIIYYGDAINLIKEATMSGKLDAKEAFSIITDMILMMARLDINFKRKRRAWRLGTIDENIANLVDNQWTFISGLHKISNPIFDKDRIDLGIKLIQESIEIMAFSFNLNLFKLVGDLANTHATANTLIKTEYAPKGVFLMDLIDINNYQGIKIADKAFNTGVVPMDFFKASIYAINTDKEYGVKISEELKTYIDNMENFFLIKFFNAKDTNDNNFYTLKSDGNINRLFKGDQDITDEISIERKGITIIPFIDYSMVLVTPEMEKLDDLLDYYNKYK